MTSRLLHLDALDSLMFRDGRPFNQSDAGASEAVSIFPPHPPTVVGAIRAKLWQQDLNGRWSADDLGDGTNWQKEASLGHLSFGAPLVLWREEPVFPVPLHIVEGKDEKGQEKLTQLLPGEALNTDLGQRKMPRQTRSSSLKGIKPILDRYVTTSGMKKILDGQIASLSRENDLIKCTELWVKEPRVGIGIDKDTRTTSGGQLYMATHVRMADDAQLAVRLDGWNKPFQTAIGPFSGEHRAASISEAATPFDLPNSEMAQPKGPTGKKHFVVAISPVVPDPDAGFAIEGLLSDSIESACLGKPLPIGGWDFKAKGPIPLRQCIPAGSVWFLSDQSSFASGDKIGKAQEWGFGQILVGQW